MDDIQSKIERMRGLIATIKAADTAYFRDDRPIMSDRDYDVAVDLLKKLEQKNGITLSDSPTQKVPGEILESLTEVRHTRPMLSADKTKSVDDLVRFAGGRDVVLSWKLDGLTLVLRYDGGQLQSVIFCGQFNTCLPFSLPAPAFSLNPTLPLYLLGTSRTILRYARARDIFNAAHRTVFSGPICTTTISLSSFGSAWVIYFPF